MPHILQMCQGKVRESQGVSANQEAGSLAFLCSCGQVKEPFGWVLEYKAGISQLISNIVKSPTITSPGKFCPLLQQVLVFQVENISSIVNSYSSTRFLPSSILTDQELKQFKILQSSLSRGQFCFPAKFEKEQYAFARAIVVRLNPFPLLYPAVTKEVSCFIIQFQVQLEDCQFLHLD